MNVVSIQVKKIGLKTQPVIILLFSLLNSVLAQDVDTTQQIIANRENSIEQQKKPYIILISADGFRYDLAKKYNAVNLLRFAEKGVTASYLQPSFPSATFPNHYTIVTGLYPSHHGLVDNYFYDESKKMIFVKTIRKIAADSSWYGGTPIWVLAEQNKMLTATSLWAASEFSIKGIKPTYHYFYNEKTSIDTRIQAVKNWLQLPEEKRPHLITFYLREVDHEEHEHGPDSEETAQAVHFVDETLNKLVKTVDSLDLPVNFIFVSDHGMIKIDNQHTLALPTAIDSSKFVIPYGESLLHLYAKNKKDIRPTYKALKKQDDFFDVYLATQMPKRWHYSKKDDRFNRIGDIIIIPKLPKIFNLNGRTKINPGNHGFDPYITEMHASFYAWGPAFKEQLKTDSFENIHIYPLLAKILGLQIQEEIDGKLEVLEHLLK